MFPYKLPWIRFSPLILFALLLNSLQASAVPIKYDENTSRNNTMEIEPIESKNTTGKEMEKLELLHNHHHHGHHHVHVHRSGFCWSCNSGAFSAGGSLFVLAFIGFIICSSCCCRRPRPVVVPVDQPMVAQPPPQSYNPPGGQFYQQQPQMQPQYQQQPPQYSYTPPAQPNVVMVEGTSTTPRKT
ncbi:unnamed protein product [Bursaphelenchus xylophilus]|nr:unnamed protein product [Bursaphelenchus xylophilus]CAG9089288.1 unnamed protein product [Bursaphelenchus xylophilus]